VTSVRRQGGVVVQCSAATCTAGRAQLVALRCEVECAVALCPARWCMSLCVSQCAMFSRFIVQ
jgi:hypothetical protein